MPNSPSGDASDIGAVEAGSSPAMGGVTVSGRVRDSSGRSISNALILMTDSAGNSFSTFASMFGNFTFTQVPVGGTYVLHAQSREFEFSPFIVNVDDNISGLEIVALP